MKKIKPTIPVVASRNNIEESEPEQACDSVFVTFRYFTFALHKLLNPIPSTGDFKNI